jgi:hypothetical protein
MQVVPRPKPDGRAEGNGNNHDGTCHVTVEKGNRTMSENANVKWKTEETIRCGRAVYELAVAHRADLEPRVGAATIDGLATDVDELRNTAAGALSSRADRKASTLAQNDALVSGAAVVSAIRAAIRQSHAENRTLQADFGVGMPVYARSVPSVVGSLRMILDAYEQNPDAARAAGILEPDVERAREALSALSAADYTQEGRKLSAKQATARRRATQLRVQAGIARLVGAAHVAFMDLPELVAQFTALIPTRPGRVRKDAPAVPVAPPSPPVGPA